MAMPDEHAISQPLHTRVRANRQAFELQPVVSRSWFASLAGPLGPRPNKSGRSHTEILCLFAGHLIHIRLDY